LAAMHFRNNGGWSYGSSQSSTNAAKKCAHA
jgi:hypothetical protein